MQEDLKLFLNRENSQAASFLRIYSWKPKCISLGYSQIIEEEIDMEKARSLGWEVVRRPTGGGIVFHNEAEVTYSLVTAIDDPVLPKGLVPSYKKISEAVIAALSKLGISSEIRNSSFEIRNSSLCFSYPADYEIVIDGAKLVGSAQKRGKKALLQQGSIFVRKDSGDILSVLKKPIDPEVHKARMVSVEEILGREVGFEELSGALIEGFEKILNVK